MKYKHKKTGIIGTLSEDGNWLEYETEVSGNLFKDSIPISQEPYTVYYVNSFIPPSGIFEKEANAKMYKTKDAAKKALNKIKPILFTTEDGVDIREGHSYTCVNTAPHLWSIFDQTAKERTRLNKTVIAFKSKELAKQYLIMNKPCLSINDINEYLIRVGEKPNSIDKAFIKFAESKQQNNYDNI